MRRRLLAAVPLSVLVLLAGCGGGDTEVAASSTPASSAATSSAPAATSTAASTTEPALDDTAGDGSGDAPPFPANTEPDTGEGQPGGGPTVVTDVRIGAQDGYDRVVFEVSGTAVPGWDVSYAEAPTAAGSGQPVALDGPAFLRVTLTGVTNPYEAPAEPEVARGVVRAPGAGTVTGVFYDSVFEGQALAYVGLPAAAPFRVYALTGPSRVVVEVRG